MATISGDLKTKFTDDLGEPLVGGKVYTYHAGTSTPKDSYKDKGLAIVNTNPIVLDDAGSCDLYLNGLYRLRVLDKDGVFVEERDYMTQGDSVGASITDNANNIIILQSEVQAINERSVLKLDENNFIIGHGSANSATVHDPAFRVDKLKIAKKDDSESAKLLFNTYGKDTAVEGENVKEGSYIDPDLITQPLVKNWRDVERAAFKGTEKDSKTNLLLKAGDAVPESSAASRLVGVADGQLVQSQDARKAFANITGQLIPTGFNFDNIRAGDFFLYSGEDAPNRPPANYASVYATRNYLNDQQATVIAHDYFNGGLTTRGKQNGRWSEWATHYHSLNTKIDSKTNLLLKAGDAVPENSAASRLVGKNEGELLEAGTGGIGKITTKPTSKTQRTENGFFNYLEDSKPADTSGAPDYQMIMSTNWVDQSAGAQILIGVGQTPTLGLRTWDHSTQKYINYRKIYYEGNTKKDSKTNLLLRAEDVIPENSAASKLVGTTNGTVPLVENVQKATFSYIPPVKFKGQAPLPDDLLEGDMVYYAAAVNDLKPDNFGDDFWTLRTFALGGGALCQEAYSLGGAGINFRVRNTAGSNQNWSAWKPISSNSFTYRITTATAANVTVDSEGVLRRASSSLKYKDVIAKLELDSNLYDKAMQVKPIVYRSKSEADPKDWHFMSFIAEELGELDPSLTQWFVKTHDDEGNELDKPIKEAEGINLNAICAVLHATNVYQDKKLKELEQRLVALESNNESAE